MKERLSDSGSSAKKLDTRVNGPGLASEGPAPPLPPAPTRKRLSREDRAGSVMEGRGGLVATWAGAAPSPAPPRPAPSSAIG